MELVLSFNADPATGSGDPAVNGSHETHDPNSKSLDIFYNLKRDFLDGTIGKMPLN